MPTDTSLGPIVVDENGTFTKYTSAGNRAQWAVRDWENEEPLTSYNLGATFLADKWTIKPQIHWAKAENKYNNAYQIIFRVPSPVTFRYDGTDPRNPIIESLNLDSLDPAQHETLTIAVFTPLAAEDETKSVKIDFSREMDGMLSSLDFGFSLTDASKVADIFKGAENVGSSGLDLSCCNTPFPTGEFFDGRLSNVNGSWPYANRAALKAAGLYRTPDEVDQILNKDDEASYVVEEMISAVYAQLNFDTEIFGFASLGNFGVRYVQTDQASSGTNDLGPVSIDNDYSDVLPSFNLAVDLDDDYVIRFAAAKVMSRADYANISPKKSVVYTIAQPRIDESNPLLEPFRATQFDVTLEKYFGSNGLFSIGFFYKDIESFITTVSRLEERTVPDIFDYNDGPTFTGDFVITAPINGPGGSVRGIEFGLQQSLDGLLPVSGFGYLFNFTWADSDATYPSELNVQSSIPLPDLSKFGMNLIGYYENKQFSARVAYNSRSEFLISPTSSSNLPTFRDDYAQLDASVSYNINDNFSVSLEGKNLTEEVTYDYSGVKSRLNGQYFTGRSYMLGLKYRF